MSTEVTKSESRGQSVAEWVHADDENGNTERKRSTGDRANQDCPEKQDLLQTIARSAQASPSSVCIEENEQTKDHLRNGDDEMLEQIAGITDEPRRSNKPQDVSITKNTDVSQDQTVEKPVNNDIEAIVNDDSSMMRGNRTNNDENQEIKMEHNPTGLEQVQDTTNNVASDLSNSEPIRIADDLNAEQMLNSHSRRSVEENEQQQQQQQLDNNNNNNNNTE